MLVTELGAITDLRIPRRRLDVPASFWPGGPPDGDRRRRPAPASCAACRRETRRSRRPHRRLPLGGGDQPPRRSLDAQVAAFHRRPVTFPARYLLLDGLWVSVRHGAGRASRRVILAAYGIDALGHRELLDYRQATGDSTAAWSRLLTSLVARGLDPDAVVLAAADGAEGSPPRWPRPFPGRPPALLDPPPAQHPRGPPGCRAATLPARPAGDLPGPDAAGRRGRLATPERALRRGRPARPTCRQTSRAKSSLERRRPRSVSRTRSPGAVLDEAGLVGPGHLVGPGQRARRARRRAPCEARG